MRDLRFGYWWLCGGIGLLVYVMYATLAPVGPAPAFINDKLAHFLAFAALMVWFSGVYRPGWLPLVAVFLAAFGIAIELVQARLTYRSAEVADALFDFAGIGVAWIIAVAGLGRWAEFIETRLLPRRS
ncbi:MAG: VanZ family protein [Gammaproteobacteria bacterium]|nr:VanZ family protein [Gammaproteobacteria bacterium]MBT8443646.1 VanZ family protein [Gammaproteobacteria bacterium]NND35943.1 VanZ family protein [Gammaproteobacteria bacterium]